MKVDYIGHSGFLAETEKCYYLFDYYKGELPRLDVWKMVIVFCSHGHGDHYQPGIFKKLREMGMLRIYAVLSEDIGDCMELGAGELLSVAAGGRYKLPLGQELITYRSTDLGVAFLISEGDEIIYHAGDLNDWVWEGEKPDYNEQMTKDYRKQIDTLAKHLGRRRLSCAFVVLDPRQEKDYDRGMLYFLEKVNADLVYPMHFWGKPQVITQFLTEHPQYKDRIIATR